MRPSKTIPTLLESNLQIPSPASSVTFYKSAPSHAKPVTSKVLPIFLEVASSLVAKIQARASKGIQKLRN